MTRTGGKRESSGWNNDGGYAWGMRLAAEERVLLHQPHEESCPKCKWKWSQCISP